jgi:hypothetical protein
VTMLPNRRRIHLRERADAAAFRALRCALRLTAGHSRHCSAAPLRTNTRERPRPVHTPAWCRGCGTNPARDAGGNPKKRSIALGPALALRGAFRCRRRHPRYARVPGRSARTQLGWRSRISLGLADAKRTSAGIPALSQGGASWSRRTGSRRSSARPTWNAAASSTSKMSA